MAHDDLFHSQLETRNSKPVECLGRTFANDEERRNHFLERLREGLGELHTKPGGVPFTTVEDAMSRLKALEKWPVGDEGQIREPGERMGQASRVERPASSGADCFASRLFPRREPVPDGSSRSGDGTLRSGTDGTYVCATRRPTVRSTASMKWNGKKDQAHNTDDSSGG